MNNSVCGPKMYHRDTESTEKTPIGTRRCPLRLYGELKGAGGSEQGADLARVLDARTAFDARGDIDRGSARNANRLGQQLGGQAARQHPWKRPRSAGDQPPIKSQAIAAG